MITITETLYKKMPDDIKSCFNQLPNPSSEEVRVCFPDSGGGKAKHNSEIVRKGMAQDGSSFNAETCGFDVNKCQGMANFGDSGNASRFFKSIIYQAKASKAERNRGCEGLYILKDNTPKEDIEEIKHLLSI